MNAYPAQKTRFYDGWVLRFSNGLSHRANSVNPIYPSGMPIEEKVEACEDMYAEHGLPPVFKLTDASPAGLDEYLEARGYGIVTPTYLFTSSILPAAREKGSVAVQKGIGVAWRANLLRLKGLTDTKQKDTANAMMNLIQNDAMCASVDVDGKAVACGLCVIERGYAGLFDIVVDEEYRRHGYGHRLCGALLAEASANGAKHAYLQVEAANGPAIALYKTMGFESAYQYWYRVRPYSSSSPGSITP
jgi:GNAT superfamily N-acetyltransferase